MMKLLLSHAYFLKDDPVEHQVMKPYPPLGLLYISAYLEKEKIQHELIDTTFSDQQKWKRDVINYKPQLIAFYANFLTRKTIVELIRWIRTDKTLKDATIVAGGPDVKYHNENYLEHGVDFIIVGEGEITLVELIRHLKGETTVDSVTGIVYKNTDGKIIRNPERKHIQELDELPFPNRSRINIQQYLNTWKRYHGYNSITLNAQRGCPFTCRWCSHAVFGNTYRRRSPESVVKEIKLLENDFKPDSYWFTDDVFTISKSWLEKLHLELEKARLNISYECITRADKLSDDHLQLLLKTGCRMVWIGAESGSQKVIDLMDRRVDVKTVQQMISKASKLGIKTGTFIMLGYPGETIDDIVQTAKHLINANPDVFTINLAYPIKGTSLYDKVEQIIEQPMDWVQTPDRDLEFKRTYVKSFYPWAIRFVNNRVYLSKNMKKMNILGSLSTGLKSMVSFLMMQYFQTKSNSPDE